MADVKDAFGHLLSDPQWLFAQEGWDPDAQSVYESNFALGNGYVGSRAVLEENPAGSRAGTFFAGVFEGTRAIVPELLNAPNPINLRVSSGGEQLGVASMDVLRHRRVLDVGKGLLTRQTLFRDARKNRIDYQSLRFFSLHDRHTALMDIQLTPLDADMSFTVSSVVDASVTNMGLVTEGSKRHVRVLESGREGRADYLVAQTVELDAWLIYAIQIVTRIGEGKENTPSHPSFPIEVKKGQTARVTLHMAFHALHASEKTMKQATVRAAASSADRGFEACLESHVRAWAKKWRDADVVMTGDARAQRAVRFNLYHLLIAAPWEQQGRHSMGARTLSGEGYRGHVFWDAEIFCFPFFLYTDPAAALDMLLYRARRLDAARQLARQRGLRGAMFPWESADKGDETTPDWYKDGEGNVRRVLTGEQECHITADVAYAAVHYHRATGDDAFMLEHGLELLLETARLWASRVHFDKEKNQYGIHKVIGPDEFHENVNNNAFTNLMARNNLTQACEQLAAFEKKYPEKIKQLRAKVGPDAREAQEWARIAAGMFVPFDRQNGLVEQFEGFFGLKHHPLPQATGPHGLPVYPHDIPDIQATQYIKQSDVVMATFLLEELFAPEIKKKNYLYYEARTLHSSSLSPAIHALTAAEIGEEAEALRYFHIAMEIDLRNICGNTDTGIHAASLGGVWQAAVLGFGGFRVRGGMPSFDPRLPAAWQNLAFKVCYQGCRIHVTIDQENITLKLATKRTGAKLSVLVCGHRKTLTADRPLIHPLARRKPPACSPTEFSLGKK